MGDARCDDYESTLKSINTSSKTSHVTDHKYFSHLYNKKVEFYRSGVAIYDIASVLKKRKKENADAAKLFFDFDADLTFDIAEIDDDNSVDVEDDVY